MADLRTELTRAAIRRELEEYHAERERLYAALEEHRGKLAGMLKRGRDVGLSVTAMADLVKLNRERVSELLNDRAPRARRGRPRKDAT